MTEVNDLDIRECLGELFEDREYRRAFYLEYGFNESAFGDPDDVIRRMAFSKAGWPERAFDDPTKSIRFDAYKANNWPLKALTDDSVDVRSSFYYNHGWDYNNYQALKDRSQYIIEEALKYRAARVYHQVAYDVYDDRKIEYAIFVPSYGYVSKKKSWVFATTLEEAKLKSDIDKWEPLLETCTAGPIYRYELIPVIKTKSATIVRL